MRNILGVFGLIWKLYIAIIFCTLAILLYPFFLIVLMNPKWKKMSFNLFILWSWMMRLFCFYHVNKITESKLPDGPYVIVANHSSYLDIFFMYSLIPKHPFVFLGKSEILSYPIIRTYFKNLNIPVYRKDKSKAGHSLLLAEKAIQQGWSIAIFPEGGIPDDDNPKMIPFKDGAFKLAKSLEIPVVPITFLNNFYLFSDPTLILGPARPGIAHVIIHNVVSKEQVQSMSVKELREYCFEVISKPLEKRYPKLHQKD
jgi:1-acyl-sn-glycerol-3-phosphate acyltransferase